MRFFLMLVAAVGLAGAVMAAAPVIEHSPVRDALPNQNIDIRARIVGGTPKAVTLRFTASRDAAPFKLPMSNSGLDVYAGSIPASMVPATGEVFYYIEVTDAVEGSVESSYYTIKIRSPEAHPAPVAEVAAPLTPPPANGESSWVKPALIGGGLLAAGGIALALSSGGGGGDSPPDGNAASGTYSGTDTACTQAPGAAITCASSGLTITISDQGVVQSSDLHDGQTLSGTLSGSNFVLIGDVNESGLTGEIQYVGTVVDNRIVGSIQGSATSAGGVTTYSGTFSAVKP